MKSVVEGCEDGIDWKSVVCWLVGWLVVMLIDVFG